MPQALLGWYQFGSSYFSEYFLFQLHLKWIKQFELKTKILPDNGAQVRRGEVQPKAQVSHFFEGKKLKKNQKKTTFFWFFKPKLGRKDISAIQFKSYGQNKIFYEKLAKNGWFPLYFGPKLKMGGRSPSCEKNLFLFDNLSI